MKTTLLKVLEIYTRYNQFVILLVVVVSLVTMFTVSDPSTLSPVITTTMEILTYVGFPILALFNSLVVGYFPLTSGIPVVEVIYLLGAGAGSYLIFEYVAKIVQNIGKQDLYTVSVVNLLSKIQLVLVVFAVVNSIVGLIAGLYYWLALGDAAYSSVSTLIMNVFPTAILIMLAIIWVIRSILQTAINEKAGQELVV